MDKELKYYYEPDRNYLVKLFIQHGMETITDINYTLATQLYKNGYMNRHIIETELDYNKGFRLSYAMYSFTEKFVKDFVEEWE